ncbi:MAG: aldo/keto reductase [Candidatus Magasanikbacteria bacterium]|nr:aldo/keto reductase [Candidatus Magasanikbacteria bacterium]
MIEQPFVTLSNGVQMPQIGLGTFLIQLGAQTQQSVLWALEAGYRMFDTASYYGNESDVGAAIRASGIPRNEIFVTTKLWPTDFAYAGYAIEKGLERLSIGYVDLFLIHWPFPFAQSHAWRTLEKLYESGRARAIGVSNFSIGQLQSLIRKSSVAPMVNQIELSPFRYRSEVIDFCFAHNIAVEAYCPLTHGRRLNDSHLAIMAARYGKTPAQIMLRWLIQHDVIAIPKSTHHRRIVENISIFDFEISDEDMTRLNSLDEDFRALQ